METCDGIDDESDDESDDEEGNWIETLDAERGIPYYHNIETGETVVSPPLESLA